MTDKQAVLDRLDFRAFYQEHVKGLKVNGKAEALGCCPFHDDKNPSFGVNLDTGLWLCRASHGCGAGDVFDFYSKVHGVDFATALRELGGQAAAPAKQNAPSVLAEALRMCKAGFSVHYLKKATKHPKDTGWQKAAIKTAKELKTTFRQGYNLGFRAGLPSIVDSMAVIVLDIDVRGNENHKAEAWTAAKEVAGCDIKPTVRTGGGGAHVYFKCPREQAPNRAATLLRSSTEKIGNKAAWQVEVLSTGKNVVTPPSIHPDTGKPYTWVADPTHLTEVPPHLLVAIEEALSEAEPEQEEDTDFNPLLLPTGQILQGYEIKVEWLVKGLLPKRAITVLHGRGGIGKTWLAMTLAECIASDTPFLGMETIQAPVFYADFENPLPVLVDRTKALDIKHVRFWHISNTENPPPALDTPESELFAKLPEGSLIIFDTFRSAHRGDENDSRDIAEVLAVLKLLREKGYTVLLLHHTAKGNDSRYKGSTAILDLADHELNLCESDKKEGEDDTYYKLHTPQKSRYQTEELILDFDLEKGGFFIVPDEAEGTMKRMHEAMTSLNEEERKKTALVDRFKAGLGIPRNRTRKMLDRGTGKFWTVSHGEKNATIYHPISVCQFAAPIYTRQTEKQDSPINDQNGKQEVAGTRQDIVSIEFASLPDSLRQTEKLPDEPLFFDLDAEEVTP